MTGVHWKEGATGRLDVEDAKLEYRCLGPSPNEALTIVLLHEGLGSVALWKDFPEQLASATGMGVLVYSRRGYGKSTPAHLPLPVDYMTREALNDLPKVLNAFGVERTILFGHSDGATIAAIYVGSVEDFRVRGLILMAPHFFTEPEGLASIASARKAYEQGDLRDRLAKYHDDVDQAFLGWNDAWLNPDFKDWNVSEVIDYFRVPVLAIQGRDDEYGTLSQVSEIESRSYAPVDVAVFENCGHAPHREKAEETLREVSEFIGRLNRIEAEKVKIV